MNTQTSTSTAPALFPLEEHVVGSVGEAYRDLSQLHAPRPQSPGTKYQLRRLGVTICGICCLAEPYVVIQLLAGFDAEQSTRSQRAWLMTWFVFGQAHSMVFYNDREDVTSRMKRYLLSNAKNYLPTMLEPLRLMMEDWPSMRDGHRGQAPPDSRTLHPTVEAIMSLMVIGIAAMGGLVVVEQMILQDDICGVI